jgi:predicted MFS family arabinose efflux permease
MKMVVIERAFQGTAGSGLFQLVNITICGLFSPRKRDFYTGLISQTWAIAGVIGLVLEVIFTQYLTWRFIF